MLSLCDSAERVPEWASDSQIEAAAKWLQIDIGPVMDALPFALVASSQHVDVDGCTEPVRRYPWGSCRINNPEHSSFNLLRYWLLFPSLIKQLFVLAAARDADYQRAREMIMNCVQEESKDVTGITGGMLREKGIVSAVKECMPG